VNTATLNPKPTPDPLVNYCQRSIVPTWHQLRVKFTGGQLEAQLTANQEPIMLIRTHRFELEALRGLNGKPAFYVRLGRRDWFWPQM